MKIYKAKISEYRVISCHCDHKVFPYLRDDKGEKIIYCIITRLEEAKTKNIVSSIDPSAMVTISDVSEIQGGTFKKKNIH